MTTKKRICLHCDKPFKSAGPGNRICKQCKSNAGITYNKRPVSILKRHQPRVSDKAI